MWWFLKKSQPIAVKPVSERSQAEEGMLAQVPDLSSLDGQQVAIKIWLPELVARTLKWAADYEGVSQSNWVRARLTAYVYGRVAVLAQRIRAGRAESEPAIMFSRSAVDRGAGRWVYKVPQLGKNTVAFKVWISQQMRNDLDILARHAGVGLSPFVREAIVGDLLGRGSLPERPGIMGQPTAAAAAWERDEEVPVDLIEAAAFNDLGEAERVWVEAP
ncbi:MAG: hypothetical protein PSV40_18955 [Polaromonas sp.]|uniref:hypothetical protein n=1 Tax=Polaromonas sp. TaxID=1869339 RepID=UPI002489EB90|nr:hypothetical protein [Polaromonas sp.]MDI1271170.1 hypothetical protein [Polaromonas sp.]